MSRTDIKYRLAGAAVTLLLTAAIGGSGFAASVIKNAKPTGESVRQETQSNSKTGFHFEGTSMYTYPMLQADLHRLRKSYEGVGVDSIGSTVDGRQLYRLVIGNPQAKKKLLVVASMHAREYITTPLVLREAKDLLERKKGGDNRLDEVLVEVVPMLDPDGVAISQYAVGGLSTASARETVKGIIQSWSDWGLLEDQNKYDWYLNKWKNNANGVDLNRNFPMPGWAALNDLRNKPASDLYKGPRPASELETKALMDLVQKEQFSAALNYHSQGRVIYWSNTLASAETEAKNRRMAEIAHADTGYQLVRPETKKSIGGSSFKDWLDGAMGIPNITLEVGLGTAPVEEAQIETIWEKNRNLLPHLMDELLGRSAELPVKPEDANTSVKEGGSSVQFVAPRTE